MTRLRQAARVAGGVAVLLWWAPTLLAAVGALLLCRLRFTLAIGLGRALAGAGLRGAARAVFRHERARCDRRMAAVRGRRAHFTSTRDGA